MFHSWKRKRKAMTANLATIEKRKWKAKQNNKLVLGEKAKIRDDPKQCTLNWVFWKL